MCTTTQVLSTPLHLWSLLKVVGLDAVTAILSMILVAGLELQANNSSDFFFSLILGIKICLPKYHLLLHKLEFCLRS